MIGNISIIEQSVIYYQDDQVTATGINACFDCVTHTISTDCLKEELIFRFHTGILISLLIAYAVLTFYPIYRSWLKDHPEVLEGFRPEDVAHLCISLIILIYLYLGDYIRSIWGIILLAVGMTVMEYLIDRNFKDR